MTNLNKFDGTVGGSKNLGTLDMKNDSFGMISRIEILPATSPMMTRENALLLATHNTMLLADLSDRAYITPICDDITSITQAPVDYTSKGKGTISRIKEYPQSYNVLFGEENEYFYRNMLNFDKTSAKIILFDANGNMMLTEDGEGVNGYDANFEVSTRALSDGTKHREYMLRVNMTSVTQYKNKTVVLRPIDNAVLPFSGDDLKSIRDASMELVGTPTATTVRVKVTYRDTVNGFINGLSQATPKVDFLNDGVSATITASVAEGNGEYTLTGTFANGDVISLNKPALLSIKAVNPVECIQGATIVGLSNLIPVTVGIISATETQLEIELSDMQNASSMAGFNDVAMWTGAVSVTSVTPVSGKPENYVLAGTFAEGNNIGISRTGYIIAQKAIVVFL